MSDSAATDAAARRRAQTEFDAPLLLEAGAGTGKTAVLVARIVAWCLGPGWERVEQEARVALRPRDHAGRVLRGIVAITFTDSATAEMARARGRRVRGRAARCAAGRCARRCLPPPGVRGARAAAFRLALDQLRVHTIHAFCLRLLLAHPLEAGVHPRLAVDADGQAVAARGCAKRCEGVACPWPSATSPTSAGCGSPARRSGRATSKPRSPRCWAKALRPRISRMKQEPCNGRGNSSACCATRWRDSRRSRGGARLKGARAAHTGFGCGARVPRSEGPGRGDDRSRAHAVRSSSGRSGTTSRSRFPSS